MDPDSPILLFDLGGVLIEFSGLGDFQALLTEPLEEAALLESWVGFDILHEFELGRITARQFSDAVAARWALNVSSVQFLNEWRSWTRALYPGALELLADLRARHRLAALSNTNELHWQRNIEELGVMHLFERCFASHELGLRKPDPTIYEHVISELAVPPHQIIFFDDSSANIEAALDAGMQAHRVVGLPALRACLQDLGLIAR